MINSVPAISAAIMAVQTGIREHNNTAARITSSPVDGDLPDDVIKLKIAKHAVSANLAVVKASQALMKHAVDILA